MFTSEERQVYKCPHTQRCYDPLAVKRALNIASGGKFGTLCAEKSDTANAALIKAARTAFGLPPISADGTGVLDAVVWDTLCAFTAYLRGKGTRVPCTPGASPSSDGPGNRPTTTSSP